MADAEIDELMKAYASDAVVQASAHNLTLDYSEASLDAVDKLISLDDFVGPTPRSPLSPADQETLWLASKMLGAYVGEVAVRVFGGCWLSEPDADGAIRPAIEVDGIRGFPVDKVWKRLTESEFDAVGGYCRVLRAIISRRHVERSALPANEDT